MNRSWLVSAALPAGWVCATLKDVALWGSGGTPSRSNPMYYVGDVPWFKTGELGHRLISRSEECISEEALAASSAKVFPRGSVVLAMYGATIGKVSILGVDAATNQACAVGTPDAVGTGFLYAFLISQTKGFIDAGRGGAQPNISQGTVREWPVLVSPANEQTRIIEKLEALLSDLDAGVAELKAAQKKLAKYRQSLLKAAVNGTLTASWREEQRQRAGEPEETGAQLLERILIERLSRWEAKQVAMVEGQRKRPSIGSGKKYRPPIQPSMDDRDDLPAGWAVASIDQLARVGTGVTPLRSKVQYFASGTIPWVTSSAVNNEVVHQAAEFITELALNECRLHLFPPGTLLVAMYGEGKTRGKTSELSISATINQALAALVFEGEAQECKSFVKLVLQTSYERLRERASGGVQRISIST